VDKEKEKRLNVRAETYLVEAFTAAAASNDRTASQLIRDFMREYVKKHGQIYPLKGK
jgi:predicted HicB family RNase H-like nuclease